MILDFSGIRLRQIELEDIELLRVWRNDHKIGQFMFFREHITKEMQLACYKSLTFNDFYFIIEYQDKTLGLIHLI